MIANPITNISPQNSYEAVKKLERLSFLQKKAKISFCVLLFGTENQYAYDTKRLEVKEE